MRPIVLLAAILLSLPATAGTAPAAPPKPPSCDAAEFHRMDFWLGDWNLTWDGGKGTNHVTREFSGCVIHENFRAEAQGATPPFVGASWSVYHALNKMWRQTWVDNRDGYYDLTGGPQPDGTFVLQIIRVGREPQMLRMVFADIKPDSFTWRWQGSEDGDAWTDKWVIHYARMK
ncbi:MAG TPA: hypothetical protein VN807_08255, partial [Candidatus Sulfotelmatobacter sp.]|nr:hypothetical protein [Candidatus Sulfotelmatobacter sp.]